MAAPDFTEGWINPLVLFFLTFLSTITYVSSRTVYFDRYGDCSSNSPFLLEDDQFTVLARGGDAYSTLRCELSFKTSPQERLCLDFISYKVTDCSAVLYVYDKNSATGDYMRKFSCRDEPEIMCSTSKYLTLLFKKKSLNSYSYNFELVIRDKSQSDAFLDGLDAFVMSIGVIIGIIVGVVCLIAVLAVILVCCCCKKTHSKGRVYRKTLNTGSEAESFHNTTTQQPRVQPSAPPVPSAGYPDLSGGGTILTEQTEYSSHGYPTQPYPPQSYSDQPPAYSPHPPPYNTDTALPVPVKV